MTAARSVGPPAAERAAAGGQHDAGDLAAGVGGRPQALVHGTVLGVDGHELGAGDRAQRPHHRPGGDEALLVGEGETLARRQRGDRHRQPGEPDDGVDHDVGVLDEIRRGVDDRGPRQRRGDLGTPRRVADGDAAGRNSLAWATSVATSEPDAEGDDLVAAGLGAHDVERLRADRAGRPGDGDTNRSHGSAGLAGPRTA